MARTTDEDRELWRAFSIMRRQLDLNLERRLQADAGISSADYEILTSLFDEPARRLRSGQLGDLIGWEKSRVSHQIARMEQRGLVERAACGEDARGVWVALTEEGAMAVLRAARDHESAVREHFFGVLDDDERAALRTVSAKVLDTLNPSICDEVNATAGA